MNKSSQQGFTLLEVLVALAILALVMIVLGSTVGNSIRAYDHLEWKTRAWLVASDKLVEMQVFAQWPKTGKQTDKVEQNGADWRLLTHISDGPFEGTRKVEIEVRRQEDDPEGGALYTLTALLGKPASNELANALGNIGTAPAEDGSGDTP